MIYTVEQVKNIMKNYELVFDIVRLVDPINMDVMQLNDNNKIDFTKYKCHKVWLRQERCENCISRRTLEEHKRMSKFEFVNKDIYNVISNPIDIVDDENKVHSFVIELVNKITDELLFGTYGVSKTIDKIIEYENKLYTDSLTSAYNREYFNDRHFYKVRENRLTKEVVFIDIDLKHFKSINDEYGHLVGDRVLKESVTVMKKNIRNSDSVIRMGGDEFLIVLNNCKPPIAQRIIENIKNDLTKEVVYDKKNNKSAIANFGVAYTDNYENSKECIDKMLKDADDNMYKDKRNT